MWLGNSITPLREEEWDEEEEEAEAPAPSSPPTSPLNSRFPLPSVIKARKLKHHRLEHGAFPNQESKSKASTAGSDSLPFQMEAWRLGPLQGRPGSAQKGK